MKHSVKLRTSRGTEASSKPNFPPMNTLKDKCAEVAAKHLFQLKLRSPPNEVLEIVYSHLFSSRQLTNSNIDLFAQLERIDLRNNDVTDSGIRSLAIASKGFTLRSLNLSGLRLTDDTAYALATCCPHLYSLDISHCAALTDVSLRLISTYLPQLRHLNASGCIQITDKGLACLSSLKWLCQLSIANCPGIDGFALKYVQRLPLTQLDLSANHIPLKYLFKISNYFPKLTELNLASCVEVTDTLLEQVISKCAFLKRINLQDVPLLTNKSLHFLFLHSHTISTIDLQGNKQLDLNIIANLVNKGLHVIGGSVELVVLRNRSFLDNIVLRVDMFTTVREIRQQVLQLLTEKTPNEEHRQLNNLLFQKVTYRKNGTKRPSVLFSYAENSSILAAVLGYNKNHLYLQETEQPEEFTLSQQNIFITIRRWNSEDSKPVDICDTSISRDITLLDLKTIIHQRYLPSVPVERMLVVEEETPVRATILLNNTLTLKNYALISGDVLHVEEITEAPEGATFRSSTAKYLSMQKTNIVIQETQFSFIRRKCRALANNACILPKEPINLDLTLSGWAKFEELQSLISNTSGIPARAQRLSTRVNPHVRLKGSKRSIAELMSGNTWLVMEIV